MRNVGRLLPMRESADEVSRALPCACRTARSPGWAVIVTSRQGRTHPSWTPRAGSWCPGFVDPHTHLVWAGTQARGVRRRLAGESYDGGGITTTVAATRAASDDELFALAAERGDAG